MRRSLTSVLLVTVLATVVAPVVAADSSRWRVRTLECGSAGRIDFLLPPSEFTTAFVPMHEKDGTRILTMLEVTVDGTTYVARPLAVNGGDRLVSCGYTDPDGLVIEITGLLTPGP